MPDFLERFGARRTAAALLAAAENGNGEDTIPAETEDGNGDDDAPAAEPAEDGDEAKTDDAPAEDGGDDGGDEADTADDSADSADDAPADAGDPSAANAADVARMCDEAGYASVAPGLIADKASEASVQAVLENAAEITEAVRLARMVRPEIDPQLAEKYISVAASSSHAKAMLFDKLVGMQAPDIQNTLSSDSRPNGESESHGWDGIAAKYNDGLNKRKRR